MPYQRVIFVEGEDDMHAVGHLLDQNGISACIFEDEIPTLVTEDIALKPLGGYPTLRQNLPTELQQSSELQRAGIVVDGNASPVGRWQSLSGRIQDVGGANIPDDLPAAGWVGKVGLPDRTITVGAWLMPDNHSPGAIEEFAVRLMPPDDPLWNYAEACVAGLTEHIETDRFEQLPKSKARVHTWLAWQEEPGMPIGAAIRNHFLDPESPSAQHFVAWVRRLFTL